MSGGRRQGWPRTLLGQNVLLLVATVLVTQVAGWVVFFAFVQEPRVRDAASLFAAQIVTIERVLAATPEAARAGYVARLDGRERLPPEALDDRPDPRRYPPLARYEARLFLDALAARLPPDVAVRMETGPQPRLWVRVHIAGRPYWIALPAERNERYRGAWAAAGLSLALAALAVALAYLLHRRINRPLARLADAAGHVARGEQPAPLAPDGPREIARVADAFNRMTAALADIEATRALMLAGISHDLRTPLTKLRLALALAADKSDARLASADRFIDDIDAIVQQFIDYARGGEGEDFQEGDLNALVEQLAADFTGLGHVFDLALGTLPPLAFKPVGMVRLLVNLMQNAVLYGRGGLAVRTRADAAGAHVEVLDRGPGVEPAALEQLKQPFRRGAAASEAAAGSGLGLAIANRIAQQHGGRLTLRLREGGGLCVALRLPAAVRSGEE